MTIQTPPPAAPSTPPDEPSRSDQPAIFVSKADAFLAWFKDLRASLFDFVGWWPTFKSELDSTISQINTSTGIGLRYIFSTTTADADPGAGVLRLSNATQNLATVVRLDASDANGANALPVIDLFDDSSSVNKGSLKLQHASDPSKYLILNVTAVAAPAGYRNVTASVVASSAASPFADGDELLVSFVRNGDIAVGTVSSADVQKQQYTAVTTTGTGTAYVAAPAPAWPAYTAGETLWANFHAASGAAPTINVNALGAVNLVKQLADGTYANVAAGDIPAGHRSRVTMLSPTQALVERFSGQGRLIGVQQFTATAPYTPTPGTAWIIVEAQAGAGAGGGAQITAAGQVAAGGGGGAGGYAMSRITAAFAGLTFTIGLGGTGASGAAGGNGGSSSFGALLSATGGQGGQLGTAAANTTIQPGAFGGAGGVGSGGNLQNSAGEAGDNALYCTVPVSGKGGASRFGAGAPPVANTVSGGSPATSYGAGGSGAVLIPSSGTSAAGGQGFAGYGRIWEYA